MLHTQQPVLHGGDGLRSLRGLDPWHITLAMGVVGLVATAVFRPRRGALALAGTLSGIWLIYGLWAYPVINDSRSARGVMEKAGALIGPEAELALLSWKEQNLLMADRPATVFGFLAPRADQELAAVAWLREKPADRWVLAQKLSLETCFLIERAIVVVKGWHTETFSSARLASTPEIFRFVGTKVFQQAAKVFGENGAPLKILVVPALPQDAQARDESIALLRAKGVDAIIPFRTMLADLVAQTEANRNYQKSDLLQTIRILKNYDFFKEPQLELFKPRRKKAK